MSFDSSNHSEINEEEFSPEKKTWLVKISPIQMKKCYFAKLVELLYE